MICGATSVLLDTLSVVCATVTVMCSAV
jgi:hypothetical protein